MSLVHRPITSYWYSFINRCACGGWARWRVWIRFNSCIAICQECYDKYKERIEG